MNSVKFYLVSLILLEFFDIQATFTGALPHLKARALKAFPDRARAGVLSNILMRLTLGLSPCI